MYEQKKSSFYLTMAIATSIAIGSMAIAPESANSQPLQHDTGNGVNTKNAISVPINSSASGINPNYNPTTGRVDGGGLFGDVNITPNRSTNRPDIAPNNSSDPNSPNYDPQATRTDPSESTGEIGDTGDDFESLAANQPREVSINDVAKLLQTDLNQSLEQLATVEAAVQTAEEAPRRIARRRNVADETRACVNPAIKLRQKVAEKIEQSQDFVKEVNQIDPNNGLW